MAGELWSLKSAINCAAAQLDRTREWLEFENSPDISEVFAAAVEGGAVRSVEDFTEMSGGSTGQPVTRQPPVFVRNDFTQAFTFAEALAFGMT